ncbi:hypothetical protein DFS33DRAFT_1491392 [Desarmillaria ectypa]|nr:hypothetical protein DFS33DRAFT_1491392 [Desarmillaria ectypa]
MFIDTDDANLSKSTRKFFSLYQQRSFSKAKHIGISAKPLLKHQPDDIGSEDDLDEDNPKPPYMPLKTIFSRPPPLLNLSSCRSLIFGIALARPSDLHPFPSFMSPGRLHLMGVIDMFNVDNTTPLTYLFLDTPSRLRELHLHNTWILQRIDESRYCGASSPLGALKDLELVWAKDNMIEEGKVLEAIKSRYGKLQSVIVGLRDGEELDKETLQRIQGFRELGLSIRLY